MPRAWAIAGPANLASGDLLTKPSVQPGIKMKKCLLLLYWECSWLCAMSGVATVQLIASPQCSSRHFSVHATSRGGTLQTHRYFSLHAEFLSLTTLGAAQVG